MLVVGVVFEVGCVLVVGFVLEVGIVLVVGVLEVGVVLVDGVVHVVGAVCVLLPWWSRECRRLQGLSCGCVAPAGHHRNGAPLGRGGRAPAGHQRIPPASRARPNAVAGRMVIDMAPAPRGATSG